MALTNNSVVERAQKFLRELGLPTTVFCRKVKIGTSTWYRGVSGEADIYDEGLERMDEFLKRYGF